MPYLSFQTVVYIIVDDVNDNDPVFNQSSYLAHVMENSNVSTSVVTVYATDQDQDANGRVSYALTSGNTGDAFDINNRTGMITVKGVIDRENIKQYSLTVQAEDGGHPSSRKVSSGTKQHRTDREKRVSLLVCWRPTGYLSLVGILNYVKKFS